MAFGPMKVLLAILSFLLLIAFVFVCVATGIIDWSKNGDYDWGIWRYCDKTTGTPACDGWTLTGANTPQRIKDCEGSLTATRAFSVLSIIFVAFCLCLALALLLKPSLISKITVMILLCLLVVTNIFLLCGWIMYLGVLNRQHCAFYSGSAHLGSSWYLQLFGFILGFFALIVGLLVFMKWQKTPRFAGQAPYVPGPQPGPMPYGGPSSMYPQYKSPYPYGPVPYGGGAPAYPGYAGGFGSTPAASPYQPTPYW